MKQALFSALIHCCPAWIFIRILPLLQRIAPPSSKYEDMLLARFARHYALHEEAVLKRIRKNNRFMRIREGRFPYAFFNICFLSNVIGLIVYALYRGCLPLIEIKNQQEGENIWEWYFEQPFALSDGAQSVICDRSYTDYRPNIRTGFGGDDPDFKTWSFFYHRFVRFRAPVWDYIRQEIDEAGVRENSLGLLIRGTDYTASKPKGHPIQPDVEELIQKATEYQKQYSYSAIYAATEEERLFRRISEALGPDLVRENRRSYYDKQFYQQGMQFIGDVKFDRENDNYWKGLEYLSSLVILSNCTDLVAGNCGGTEFAVLYTAGYRNKYIFNKGLYS